jgi:regulator of sigma E protease
MEGEDESSNDERAFRHKPIIQRIAVVVAGAFMNIILGFILVLILVSTSESINSVEIGGFHENSASEQSGLQVYDKILKINNMTIFTDSDISYKLSNDNSETFEVTVLRNGEKYKLNNVSFFNNQNGTRFDFWVLSSEKTIPNIVVYSVQRTASVARIIWITLIDFVTGKYGVNDLSGPVGIVGAIGTASKLGIDYFLNLVIFITINVGIFNLLPLPALDGGRILFLLVEGIRKKPIKPEHEGMVHFIGISILMLMMLFVTFNDIKKLFIK